MPKAARLEPKVDRRVEFGQESSEEFDQEILTADTGRACVTLRRWWSDEEAGKPGAFWLEVELVGWGSAGDAQGEIKDYVLANGPPATIHTIHEQLLDAAACLLAVAKDAEKRDFYADRRYSLTER